MPEQKHILIVDDEEPIRELLGEALAIAGYRVSVADSVSTAKRIVAATAPDLIITDLQLEQSDGLALIEEIKSSHPDMPTVLLTGMLFDERAVEERINKKVSIYLAKTSPLKVILAEVNRLLGVAKN